VVPVPHSLQGWDDGMMMPLMSHRRAAMPMMKSTSYLLVLYFLHHDWRPPLDGFEQDIKLELTLS
jgi:hypothetical protein